MPFYANKYKSSRLLLFGRLGLLICLALLLPACRQGKEAATSQKEVAASPVTSARRDDNDAEKADKRPVIVAFGDSLTAAYGLSPTEGYTTLLQARLDGAGYRYRVVNAGVSGDTTAGGLRRLEWSLDGDVKVVILALGGNDALRGQPVAEMKSNLARMIEIAKSRGAQVLLAGMEAPPNMGPQYTREFRECYRALARQYRIPLIPFLLEGIGGHPELNQADGIHPNSEGEKLLVENVWRHLEPELRK